MDKTAQRHMDAIQSGEITRTNIIGIRKILNHVALVQRGWPGNRSNASPDDADALLGALYQHKPRVTGPWADSGLATLRSPRYRNRFDARQSAVFSAMNAPQTFRLIDFEDIGRGHHVAVYQVSSRAGCFAFHNIPWQSGGNGPEIVAS